LVKKIGSNVEIAVAATGRFEFGILAFSASSDNKTPLLCVSVEGSPPNTTEFDTRLQFICVVSERSDN